MDASRACGAVLTAVLNAGAWGNVTLGDLLAAYAEKVQRQHHGDRATGTVSKRRRGPEVKLQGMGETLTMAEWSRRLGCGPTLVRDRLRRGWSVEDAIGTPKMPQGRPPKPAAERRQERREWHGSRKDPHRLAHLPKFRPWGPEPAEAPKSAPNR
jgi:hypothetical protein